jgi:hypothetical protein
MLFKLLAAAIVGTFTTSVMATSETGYVNFAFGQYNSSSSSAGLTFFTLDGGSNTCCRPACATVVDRWVLDNDWPAAKIQMSVLLTAAVSGKRVTVRGSDSCSVFSNTETAVDIFLYD